METILQHSFELGQKQRHLKGHREMWTPRAAGFIASFKVMPLEIFRVNKGPSIFLREWATFPPQRSTIFDIHTYEGKVLPKALNNATYQCKIIYHIFIVLPNIDFSAEWGLDAPEWAVSTGFGSTAVGKGLDYLFCA